MLHGFSCVASQIQIGRQARPSVAMQLAGLHRVGHATRVVRQVTGAGRQPTQPHTVLPRLQQRRLVERKRRHFLWKIPTPRYVDVKSGKWSPPPPSPPPPTTPTLIVCFLAFNFYKVNSPFFCSFKVRAIICMKNVAKTDFSSLYLQELAPG